MEVLCSMWNGTSMQLCSLYLCFMKKHHTFVSERPGHGEFGKKSKRNKVLKSELGGLLPLATAGKNGLMSISDKRRMGRNFSKGYWKLAESKVWYNHYGALIYGASPASTRGVLLAVCWAGIDYSANRLSGFNGNVRLYIGDNPDTGNHELWLGLTGEDGTSSEFIIKDGTIIDWGAVKVESLPSYLNEMSIS